MPVLDCTSEAAEAASPSAADADGRGVSYLIAHQNSDGGWGYHPGSQSSVEATAWALLALDSAPSSPDVSESVRLGLKALGQLQLPDGSWPSFAGRPGACWTTSLACLALHVYGEGPERLARGVTWLVDTWPAESGLGWRLRQRLFSGSSLVTQDYRLQGWSWTPGTASWVEPTAYALILLRNLDKALLTRSAARRQELGERMLYDRMCPGGGWNSGNPLVYGVGGIPRIGPTAWALIALARHRDRPENRQSADWLERVYPEIEGPASLCLAHLCLRFYGRDLPPLGPALEAFSAESGLPQGLLGSTLSLMATVSHLPKWFTGGIIDAV